MVDGAVYSTDTGDMVFSNYNITASGFYMNSSGIWEVNVSGFVLREKS